LSQSKHANIDGMKALKQIVASLQRYIPQRAVEAAWRRTAHQVVKWW